MHHGPHRQVTEIRRIEIGHIELEAHPGKVLPKQDGFLRALARREAVQINQARAHFALSPRRIRVSPFRSTRAWNACPGFIAFKAVTNCSAVVIRTSST